MEEENTPQQDQNQENVWKTLGTNKPEDNVWKTLGTGPADPAAQKASFVFRESAKRDPARAADVLRLSKLYNVSEQQADRSLEILKQAERYQNPDIQNLPDTNPKLSDFMTQSIDTAAATQKHLPALRQLDTLYSRPPGLLPVNDATVQADSEKISQLRAAKDWASGQRIDYSALSGVEGEPAAQFTSQEEMQKAYYQEELSKRRAIESLMAGTSQMNLREIQASKFPGDKGSENLFSLIPFARYMTSSASAIQLAEAKKADAAGTSDEIQKDLIKQNQRLLGIQQLRGKGFWSGLGEQFMGFPAMATEFATGTGIAKGVATGLGLSKALAFFAEPAIGAATAGAPEAAQTFIQNKGEGDSTPEAAVKAARDAYANYMGAHIFGPWFTKASPEAQALVKESLLKAIPVEGLKMPLMNAASEMLKAVGPDFADHLKQTEIFRALDGDPEAIKSITQQFIVGATSGGIHAYKRNSGIDDIKRDAQTYAEATLKRGDLLHEEFAKEFPQLAAELSQHLVKDGPNEHTYVPVQAFRDYYEGKNVDPRAVAEQLTGDPDAFDSAKRSGADLVIPTAAYDHGIGSDPDAAKFFSNEIRPEPGAINLREAGALEKAYANGVRIPARQRVVDQIVEQAKGNKIDEALGMADLAQGGDDLTKDPAVLGLSGDQVAKLGQALGKARQAAKDIVNAKEQDRLDRLKGDLYEKEKARTTEQVTKEVDRRPEQLALARLQKHQLPDGTPLSEDVPKIKLSRQAIEAEGYSASSLPKGVVADGNFATWGDTSTHGHALSPEDAAPMLGFKSTHDMMLALAGLQGKAREEAIKYETDSRMAQKFPMGLQPAELSLEAEKALHNKEAAKLQHLTLEAIEANKLKKMVGVATRKLQPLDEITSQARRDIAKERLQTLDPNRWLRAEQDAMRAAKEAVFTTKWEDVFDKRLEALHAHEMYRAAVEALETTGKAFSKWEKLPEAGYLNKPTTYDWGQQVKNLLRKIGLVSVEPRDLATMEPFDVWAQKKVESGDTRMESIRIDPKFAEDSFTTTPKDMTYQDVLSLKDTIDQITMYAREADKIQTDANKASLQSYVKEVADKVGKNFKVLPPEPASTEDRTAMESALHFVRKWDTILDSPESFFNRMDGGDIEGPMNRLFQGQVEARTKLHELKARFTDAITKATNDMPDAIRSRLGNREQVEGLTRPLTRREIMALVLNSGNESNFSKMIRGEQMRGKDALFQFDATSPEVAAKQIHDTIQRAAEKLTEQEKNFIQKVLDITNSFWPELEKLHIWATGKPPEKVEAKQMIKAMGDRPGGYYTAMYDPRYGKAGEIQVSGELGKLVDPSYTRATTDSGARESRIESYAAPMDLNFSRLASHVESMAKDIAFRPWLLDANKIVNHPDFQRTMSDHFGSEFKDFANEWIKRTVGVDGASSKSLATVDGFLGAARHNVTVASLALKPAVFLHHALGFGPAIAEVGPARFAKAYAEFLKHPAESYKQMVAESKEMANYLETSDVNIRQSLKRIAGKEGMLAELQRFGMKIIPWGNMLRAIPTYYAAKEKATAELSAKGKTGAELEKLAIQSAEKAVRTTSGSGNPGDVPAIMKSDGMKLLLMFYTPGRVLYSQMRSAGHDLARGDVGKALFKAFWLLPFSAAIHTLVSGRRPDEDKDESELGMYAKDAILYPASALPMGHALAKNALDAMSGEGHDFSVSVPMFDALEKTFKSVKKGHDWFNDEAEFEDVAREMFKASGYWLGAPTEQMERSGGYVADLLRDKESPNDIFEFSHDLLWRKPKSRR